MENKHRSPRDAVFSVFLPHSAFITSYQLYIRNHTFKGEIIEPKHLNKPTDWVSPSTVVMEDEHEWRVKVRMEAWDEVMYFFFETFHKIQIIYFIISYDITELTDRIFYLMEKIS